MNALVSSVFRCAFGLSLLLPSEEDIRLKVFGKSWLLAMAIPVMSPDRLSTQYKQYDIVAAVLGIWRCMPCNNFPVLVKGRQDDVIPPSELSRLERMNISVDRSAKGFLRRCLVSHADRPSGRYTFGLPVVRFAGEEVSTELYKTLMDHCTYSALCCYCIENLKIAKQ